MMAAWVLFGVLVFLVFGIPLIDELYRLRTRRAANRARQIVHDATKSLVPDDGEQNLPGRCEVVRVKKLEHVE
jgi:hypothetical protein